jgi:hypothetical protein
MRKPEPVVCTRCRRYHIMAWRAFRVAYCAYCNTLYWDGHRG